MRPRAFLLLNHSGCSFDGVSEVEGRDAGPDESDAAPRDTEFKPSGLHLTL